MAKNARAIFAIQDAFNCCGFRTVKDRAYPYKKGFASECAALYDRNSSCFKPWRQAEQINAGLLLLVASIVFIVKVSILAPQSSQDSVEMSPIGFIDPISAHKLFLESTSMGEEVEAW